jgi:dynein intermediate chain 2
MPHPATLAAAAVCAGHHGAVYALSRSPFFPKFFMSVGDWTARLWNEDLRSDITSTPYAATQLTGGAWSPTRPGLFYTISHGGVLDAWDYYYKQQEPVLSVKVSDRPLTALAVQAGNGAAKQRMAAIGSHDGAVTLLQLSSGLVEVQDNEKAVVGAVSARSWADHCAWQICLVDALLARISTDSSSLLTGTSLFPCISLCCTQTTAVLTL